MEFENNLWNYILKEILPNGDPNAISDDTDLLESGILDSFSILKLASHIEDVYQIEVGLDELVPENIGSLKKVAAFINHKVGNRHM